MDKLWTTAEYLKNYCTALTDLVRFECFAMNKYFHDLLWDHDDDDDDDDAADDDDDAILILFSGRGLPFLRVHQPYSLVWYICPNVIIISIIIEAIGQISGHTVVNMMIVM